MRVALQVLCILIALTQAVQALSKGTADSSFCSKLASCATFFINDHKGRSPTSWSDLQVYINKPMDEAFPGVLPTKRYAILSTPLDLPSPHKGELLLIARRPFRDRYHGYNRLGGRSTYLGKPGRYIVYRKDDNFYWSFVTEAYVQQAFRGFGALLPSPDTEGGRPHEKAALVSLVLALCTLAAVGYAVVNRLLKHRSWRRLPRYG